MFSRENDMAILAALLAGSWWGLRAEEGKRDGGV